MKLTRWTSNHLHETTNQISSIESTRVESSQFKRNSVHWNSNQNPHWTTISTTNCIQIKSWDKFRSQKWKVQLWLKAEKNRCCIILCPLNSWLHQVISSKLHSIQSAGCIENMFRVHREQFTSMLFVCLPRQAFYNKQFSRIIVSNLVNVVTQTV